MSISDSATLGDAELISRVRDGDLEAYGDLFARHRDAAMRLARSLGPGTDADDLVAEAFAKVLSVLRGGGGPDLAFRAYLLTSVRRCHVDRLRGQARTRPTDDLSLLDRGEEFSDPAVTGFESSTAARAFASLPERWQTVLWHLDVEGQKPAAVAPLLGMSANSVSALAYRAREGLRQAYVQLHAGEAVDEECHRTHQLLGGYVRHGLSRRDNQRVSRHLEGCPRCTALYLELTEVNSSLAAVLGPLVLGGAAAAYLSGATGAATTAGAGLGVTLGRARDLLLAHAQTVLVAGAALGIAGTASIGLVASAGPASVADARLPSAIGAPSDTITDPAPSTEALRRVHRPVQLVSARAASSSQPAGSSPGATRTGPLPATPGHTPATPAAPATPATTTTTPTPRPTQAGTPTPPPASTPSLPPTSTPPPPAPAPAPAPATGTATGSTPGIRVGVHVPGLPGTLTVRLPPGAPLIDGSLTPLP